MLFIWLFNHQKICLFFNSFFQSQAQKTDDQVMKHLLAEDTSSSQNHIFKIKLIRHFQNMHEWYLKGAVKCFFGY